MRAAPLRAGAGNFFLGVRGTGGAELPHRLLCRSPPAGADGDRRGQESTPPAPPLVGDLSVRAHCFVWPCWTQASTHPLPPPTGQYVRAGGGGGACAGCSTWAIQISVERELDGPHQGRFRPCGGGGE